MYKQNRWPKMAAAAGGTRARAVLVSRSSWQVGCVLGLAAVAAVLATQHGSARGEKVLTRGEDDVAGA
eukprot:CAMPEP_0181241448 /NCGR_PEP_ID=MMETSP1096-20121128/41126_1 /TAXON_ID=156174 ORGANISM="Chrysochromulina ericina, Strain CCMP281" /NCGR_SAMPLE_ID=MMETSP1096 /ASSEMBLY_ACC=CAM_ASM_000453 /LENGTH=67 /DNA_ID=CAMNT_0023337519 /DNA_START=969 /DNA_END=1168 /DNA_ORIENTATION=+